MAEPHIEDLRLALSRTLLESDPVPGGPLPEHQLIDRLVARVEDYDMGDMTTGQLRTIFKNNPVPQFDFDQWLSERVADGTYHPSALEDDDQ